MEYFIFVIFARHIIIITEILRRIIILLYYYHITYSSTATAAATDSVSRVVYKAPGPRCMIYTTHMLTHLPT